MCAHVHILILGFLCLSHITKYLRERATIVFKIAQTILLEFQRKTSRLSSCKAQQLPGGGRWEKRRSPLGSGWHGGQPRGRERSFRRERPECEESGLRREGKRNGEVALC